MKKLFTNALLLLFITTVGSSIAIGQRVEKNYKESFKSDNSTVLDIDSKFGEVKIMAWDQNTVDVEVVIWVESNREEKAEELLSRLDAELSTSDNRIHVKSILPEKLNTRKDTKFQIDINIQAPEDINLQLSSKYGSAFIDELNGHADISVAYGNLKVMELSRGQQKPLNHIHLAYSSASIEEAGWMKMDLKYSKVSIEEAQAIMAISKYSVLSAEECSSMVIESKYDTYSIGELNNFLGEMKYGNIKIGELEKKLEIESAYTSLKLGEVGSSFEMIKVENSRGGYKLGISEDASFTIKGEAIGGDISVSGMSNLNRKVENANKYIDGTHGSNPTGRVELEVKQGSIKIELD